MEEWKNGRMEEWNIGRLGDCEKGRLGAYEKSVGRSSGSSFNFKQSRGKI